MEGPYLYFARSNIDQACMYVYDADVILQLIQSYRKISVQLLNKCYIFSIKVGARPGPGCNSGQDNGEPTRKVAGCSTCVLSRFFKVSFTRPLTSSIRFYTSKIGCSRNLGEVLRDSRF